MSRVLVIIPLVLSLFIFPGMSYLYASYGTCDVSMPGGSIGRGWEGGGAAVAMITTSMNIIR